MAATRVDFYLVGDAEPAARLRTACRIAEKAYDQGLQCTVRASNAAEAAQFDEMLWTWSDRSFVPHALWPQDEPALEGAAVLVTSGALPESHRDVLINLCADAPASVEPYARLADIVGADEDSRRAGRLRWRAYREAGLEPGSHTV